MKRVYDIDDLREKLKIEYYGAAFGGGFKAALSNIPDIDNATDEEIIEMAKKKGLLKDR